MWGEIVVFHEMEITKMQSALIKAITNFKAIVRLRLRRAPILVHVPDTIVCAPSERIGRVEHFDVMETPKVRVGAVPPTQTGKKLESFP
ncbi:hypothetical protein PanWU01x14_093230 [Parasponia andersonii]|uniref:Uncharacterized protein n=1 Tax=Parasponia andersonii TaxID=3476 RepID=A0A2P5D631_PARAD|nr:hypothetical protein PanWU01x14_093230 [Parasponia andersonii]